MSLPVAPELFDVLTQCAKSIAQDSAGPTPPKEATSQALAFCENFYGQFFRFIRKVCTWIHAVLRA